MKKSSIAIIAVLAAFVVQADVLYWMVADDIAATASQADDTPFAALYVAGDTLSPNPTQLDSRTGGQVWTAAADGATFKYTGIDAYNSSSFSFYIEILSGQYDGYKTENMSYSQLANYIIGGGTASPSSSFNSDGFGGGTGTGTFNVPEPTSGLLFLVGGMLLGLKRRRQQV